MSIIGSPSIGLKQLSHLSRRLAIAIDAGLDIRGVILREAGSGPRVQRRKLTQVSESIGQGESFADALDATNPYFPRLFRDMVRLGDETGSLDRVLVKLADHYDHLRNVRRGFLLGILFPGIYLLVALAIIGLLILALGWVARYTGETVDVLGYGMVGVRGLIRYIAFLSLVAAAGYFTFWLLARGPLAAAFRNLWSQIPWIGDRVKTIALARMAWTMAMAHDAGAGARQTMRLALSSTQSEFFNCHADRIDQALRRGSEMHEAMRGTGAFPPEFLDAVAVGEASGRLSESLEKLAEQYQAQGKAAMVGLAVLATFAVWGSVVCIMVFLIFRLASFYFGIINEAAQGF